MPRRSLTLTVPFVAVTLAASLAGCSSCSKDKSKEGDKAADKPAEVASVGPMDLSSAPLHPPPRPAMVPSVERPTLAEAALQGCKADLDCKPTGDGTPQACCVRVGDAGAGSLACQDRRLPCIHPCLLDSDCVVGLECKPVRGTGLLGCQVN